jgi:hypothetical protein
VPSTRRRSAPRGKTSARVSFGERVAWRSVRRAATRAVTRAWYRAGCAPCATV